MLARMARVTSKEAGYKGAGKEPAARIAPRDPRTGDKRDQKSSYHLQKNSLALGPMVHPELAIQIWNYFLRRKYFHRKCVMRQEACGHLQKEQTAWSCQAELQKII